MLSPLMVFVSDLQIHGLRWADQSTEEGPSNYFGDAEYSSEDWFGGLRSMTHYADDVFVTDKHGSIISTMTCAADEVIQLQCSARTLQIKPSIKGPTLPGPFPENLCYLVESDGELLYVVSGRAYNDE